MPRMPLAGWLSVLLAFPAAAERMTEPQLSPMPSPRAYAAASVVGERIYLFGGYAGAPGRVPATVSFEPASGRWSDHAPIPDDLLPGVMIGGSSIQLGGKVLMGSASDATTGTVLYDPVADAWSAGPPFRRVRAGEGIFSAGGRVVALGGTDHNNEAVTAIETLEGGRWRESGRIPSPHAYPSMVAIGRKIYLAGGALAVPGATQRIDTLDEYDAATGAWRTLSPMPTARRGAAIAALGGLLYVVGGDAAVNGPALPVTEVYDPATDSWTEAPPPPQPRVFSSAVAYGGRLYVFGGFTPSLRGSVTVQVYDPAAQRWRLADGGPPLRPVVSRDSYRVVRRAVPPRPAEPEFRFERRAEERPQDYALVVGVGAYERLPPAEYADRDAREMASAFGALGVPEENVVTLTGSKATMSEVTKYVEEWLPRRVTPESRVYFYFSGHGAPDVKDGSAYLMPYDADSSFVKSTGFSLRRLYESLGALQAGHVIAMIDACFSGAGGRSVVERGIRPLVNVQLPKKLPPRITVLAAAESEEIAGSLPERGHGLFSYYALQGLSGAADVQGKGHVTVTELYHYIHKHVIVDARRQNREQTPTLTTPTPKLRLY